MLSKCKLLIPLNIEFLTFKKGVLKIEKKIENGLSLGKQFRKILKEN